MTDMSNLVEMGNVVILDDEASARAITEAQMQLTARRFGIGGQGGPLPATPVTEVGGPRRQIAPPAMPSPAPVVASSPAAPGPAASPNQHLLLTPSSKPGQLRVVHMHGPHKVASWALAEDAAQTVMGILGSFGISITDLRESEEEPA